jgi:UDPglucose 6-dehydrogenase
MRCSVIGTGRVGAAHAATLASLGHQVVGVDRDRAHVATLRSGRSPYAETGLSDLLEEGIRRGRIDFTTDLGRAAAEADVHFLCVGTPSGAGGEATDLGALERVVAGLVPLIDRPALLAGRSTVPVGTAEHLTSLVRDKESSPGLVQVAWNPEFLREGQAVADSLRPDRIVLGVAAPEADLVLRAVYAPLIAAGVPVLTTDLATAELAKASANVMLAARISLVNVLAEVCERSGADVRDLVEILGSDPRIGRDYLQPGLGYGGSCLPKDLRSFVARGRELGLDGPLDLIRRIDDVNRHQRERTVALARGLLDDDVSGRRVAVLGAAFKAGIDDVRESPALAVIAGLLAEGAQVRVHDVAAMAAARAELPGPEYVAEVRDACAGADLVLLLTDWPEYAALDPEQVRGWVARPQVLDARLLLDHDAWVRAGWRVRALGRPG